MSSITRATPRKTVPHIPFKAHGAGGVRARGTVHEIRRQDDGKTHRVTIRHEDPAKAYKRSDAMAFDAYNHETSAMMGADEAANFHVGQPVHVTITPGDEDDSDAPPKKGGVTVAAHARGTPAKGLVRRAAK